MRISRLGWQKTSAEQSSGIQPKAPFWSLFLSQFSGKPHRWRFRTHILIISLLFSLPLLTCFFLVIFSAEKDKCHQSLMVASGFLLHLNGLIAVKYAVWYESFWLGHSLPQRLFPQNFKKYPDNLT
ncbi:hypothetical protein [Pantoea agglomerans]|jgi:hypothetical protein|uniref:hypothetical protein n=1 Tax=Pantoea sp. ANP04 TaxID=3064896 RepID=UPI0012B767D7|nr:hypothetical protein [Pantoea agglomerans]